MAFELQALEGTEFNANSGKTCEFHVYIDREQYRQHAAVDGWKKVFTWFEKQLH